MTTPIAEAAAPVAAPPAEAPRPAPLLSRIVDTFVAPTRVFEQFREGPAPWLGPVLVSIAVTLLMIGLTPVFISNRQAAEVALQKMQEMGSQQPVTLDQMADRMPMQYAFAAVGTLIFSFVWVWLLALVLWALSALLLSGRATLRAYAAVASHAGLVTLAGQVLLGVLKFATGRLDLTLDAALLAPGIESPSVASSLLHALTPWGIWTVLLLALGAATVNRKKGWVGVAVALFALQLAFTTAGALFAAMLRGRAAGG